MGLNNLKIGTSISVDVLVKKIETGRCSNGSTYKRCFIVDAENNSLIAKAFDVEVTEGVHKLILNISEFNGQINPKIVGVEVSEMEEVDFFPKAKIDQIIAWNNMIEEIKTLPEKMMQLCCVVLNNVGIDKFKTAPLTAAGEYATVGGLLEYVTKAVALAKEIANVLGLNKDLMIASAILYNCGAAACMECIKEKKIVNFVSVPLESYRIVYNAIEYLNTTNEKAGMDDLDMIILNIISTKYEMPGSDTCAESVAMRHIDYLVCMADRINTEMSTQKPDTFNKTSTGMNLFKPKIQSEE